MEITELVALLQRTDSQPGGAQPLTPRQRQVLDLESAGYSREEIALVLGISVATARNHLQHSYRGLGVNRRADAIDAFQSG